MEEHTPNICQEPHAFNPLLLRFIKQTADFVTLTNPNYASRIRAGHIFLRYNITLIHDRESWLPNGLLKSIPFELYPDKTTH